MKYSRLPEVIRSQGEECKRTVCGWLNVCDFIDINVATSSRSLKSDNMSSCLKRLTDAFPSILTSLSLTSLALDKLGLLDKGSL